ncbi:MAG: MoaD/ThiS family protein [Sphingomonadales bacterium]|jgi:molybdopterin synthase sulfur carrier subunit
MLVDLLYFGDLRAALGRDSERVDPPSHVLTILDLVAWLSERGADYQAALADRSRICAAIDLEHCPVGDSFFGAREVALFSPVRGL